jgi:hypothetical protein
MAICIHHPVFCCVSKVFYIFALWSDHFPRGPMNPFWILFLGHNTSGGRQILALLYLIGRLNIADDATVSRKGQ